MIAGYSKIGHCSGAVMLLEEMQHQGVQPDVFTFVSLLSVSSKNGNLDLGRFVHLYIVTTDVQIDSIVKNALIDMYAKCGHFQCAKCVFDRMLHKNVVSWTCMVNAYANHGLIDNAVQTFNQMPVKNVVSWNSIIWCLVQEGLYTEAMELFHRMCISDVIPDNGMASSSGKRVKTMGNKRKDPERFYSNKFLSHKHEQHFQTV
ncbi:pentatricopeptide repeat-containing protein At4g14050, mitochondrial-like [Vigna angularis]|uniref:pentatricopeptide repeat-containing protein At4g14050, mitochondrial-like n=1 Tax=Phaseolus angularis TaxID=3914 RepID=UPI0022B31007|nr:pentatricopeptide repeat-containing protein At4g14050, mitochondrial-like [Vigna angularis]